MHLSSPSLVEPTSIQNSIQASSEIRTLSFAEVKDFKIHGYGDTPIKHDKAKSTYPQDKAAKRFAFLPRKLHACTRRRKRKPLAICTRCHILFSKRRLFFASAQLTFPEKSHIYWEKKLRTKKRQRGVTPRRKIRHSRGHSSEGVILSHKGFWGKNLFTKKQRIQ